MVVLYGNRLELGCLNVTSKEEYLKVVETEKVECVILNHFICNSNKREMIENNIPAKKIYVTGIPISLRFSQNFNKEQIFSEFNLDKNKKKGDK